MSEYNRYTPADKARDLEILNTPIFKTGDSKSAKIGGEFNFDSTLSLPSTLYKGMPTDNLAAVDAYEVQDEINVVNNFRRKSIDGILDLKNAIVDATVNDLLSIDNIADTIASGNLDKIKSEGLGMLSSSASRMVNDIAPGLLDNITSGLSGVADKVLENIPVTLIMDTGSELLSNVVSSDLVKGMSTLLHEVKNSNFVTGAVNLVSQSAVLGELGALSVELGIPQFAEDWANLTHDSIKDVTWARIGSAAIEYSDLPTLNKALAGGGGAFIERYVDRPANELLKNFKYKPANGDLSDSWSSLKSTLDELDPKWDRDTIDGEDRFKLDNFFELSDDAKLVMTMDDVYRPIAHSVSVLGRQFHRDLITDTVSSGTNHVEEIKHSLRYMDCSICTESTIA